MDQRSLAALLLTNRLTHTAAQPYTASQFWALVERIDLAALPGASAETLRDHGLSADEAERASRLMDASGAFAVAVDRLDQSGVQVIAAVDADYPERLRQRLGSSTPPVLYVAGPPSMVWSGAIAVVGDGAHVDDEAPAALGAAAAEAGVTIVHGAEKGPGRTAATAGLENGGDVVSVLGEGLERHLRRPDVRQAVRAGRLAVCTPYPPSAEATDQRRAARWKIVHGLAARTVVIGSGSSCGASEAAELGCDVRAWSPTGEDAGPEPGASSVTDLVSGLG